MDKMFSFLLDFIIVFTVVYLLYVLFFNKKRRNYKTLKKNDEVKLFIDRYNLDMKKIEYILKMIRDFKNGTIKTE